jgi:hypothetical protein
MELLSFRGNDFRGWIKWNGEVRMQHRARGPRLPVAWRGPRCQCLRPQSQWDTFTLLVDPTLALEQGTPNHTVLTLIPESAVLDHAWLRSSLNPIPERQVSWWETEAE